MALPQFGFNGLLPDGVHFATPLDLIDRCVFAFTVSTTRARIYENLMRYQKALASTGLHVTQWVDGSFTDRTRTDSEDVDLANFVDAAQLNQLNPGVQVQAKQLLDGRKATKMQFDVHSFLIIKFPPGHPLEAQYERGRQYWRRWFATAQDYAGQVKVPAPTGGKHGRASSAG